MADVRFVVVVSLESPDVVARCLETLAATGRPVIIVDNASPPETASILEDADAITTIRLGENIGYGAAANVGIEASASDDVLLLNADAWPLGDGLDRLLACRERRPRAGILGPTLVGADGSTQPSQFGFPTRWWTGSAAMSSWPERARRARVRGADAAPRREVVVVGAALLLRRTALSEVGAFDPAFFLFNEEVDLAWRMVHAGWTVELCPDATFLHVGGSAARRNWAALYREQVRGHLLFLAKHHGVDTAERARRYLAPMLRARSLVAAGEQRSAYRDTAGWLSSARASDLIGTPGRTTKDRRPAPADRTSGSDR